VAEVVELHLALLEAEERARARVADVEGLGLALGRGGAGEERVRRRVVRGAGRGRARLDPPRGRAVRRHPPGVRGAERDEAAVARVELPGAAVDRQLRAALEDVEALLERVQVLADGAARVERALRDPGVQRPDGLPHDLRPAMPGAVRRVRGRRFEDDLVGAPDVIHGGRV
jgi:hypothetical protein